MSPDSLPPIPQLRLAAKSLAMLDAILCPEWEYRYYSFNSRWGAGEEMASMRNGSGDDWFLLFNSAGAALKGFAHELAQGSQVAEQIQRQVPKEFSSFLSEPAFSMQNATYCYWCLAKDGCWSKVESDLPGDGSQEMLSPLLLGAKGYAEWAEEYFEVTVDPIFVQRVINHEPLSEEIVRRLNPEASLEQIHEDASEIGYPHGAV